MQNKPLKLAAATAFAAALAFGGMSLASAQEDSPGSDAPAADVDENCPHGDGAPDTTSA
jgi:hypothetical protein